MSEIDRAIRALRNAHEAGDAEAAKKIANALKQMVPAEREEVGNVGGLSAMVTQGALMGFGDEALGGLSAVLGVQPDGEGGADWFQYDKPIGERYAVARDAIRSEMDEYREENPIKAGAAQIGGAIGTAVAGAAALPARGAVAATRTGRAIQAVTPKAAATPLGRAGQMAAGGAAGAAVEGFGSAEGGVGNRAINAALMAPVGAIFAPLVGFGVSKIANKAQQIGGAVLRRVFTNRQMLDPVTGELTIQGQRRLAELGYDPRALSAEMQRAFGEAAERVPVRAGDDVGAEAIGRIATADRFGVPLTRGQATGSVAQSASEESMRAGVRGAGASQVIEGFDNVQRGAVDTARQNIAGQVGEGTGNRIDAADAVIDGVRREAEAARGAGRQAYEVLDQSGAAISGDAFGPLRAQIESAVRAQGLPLDAGTPNAQAALNVLESTFQGSGTGSVPFAGIERARQRLNSLRRAAYSGSNGADQIAIDAAIREFDGFLDDTITDALISGSAGVLDDAKNARQLWSRYRQTFLSREGADNFIRKIVEDDLAPDQVAGWLFGASRNIGGGQTSLVAQRVKDILGPESAEFAAVRRAAWDHITTPIEGKQLGPQAIASNISELLNGKGQTLGKVLFSERDLRVMGEFRDMLRLLEPPGKATNRSGSGYQVERGMQNLLTAMAGIVGNANGGPLAGATAAGAVKIGGSFSGTLQARAAARGVGFPPASVPVAIGAGVGSAAATRDTITAR